ncbi:MAG TPA: aminodeoxychorismate synthase component I [Candidatus Udaeobacter sp.]|jgi:para-aminobenzoate synthetase component 1|nr:aminodeoxychorismate synthase component I [Candidatus Udaeobacter sp.]
MCPVQALPLACAIPISDPLDALGALEGLPYPFLLHSALEDDRARWSFFGADPFAVHRGGDHTEAIREYRALAACVGEGEPHASLVPFTGGAVGYWAYDYGRRLEPRRADAAAGPIDDAGLPDFVLGFYDVVGVFDHRTRETWLFSSGLPLEGAERAQRAAARLERFESLLLRNAVYTSSRITRSRPIDDELPAGPVRAASNFDPDGYRRAIERVRDHIRRGDLYQANLSQRWTVPYASREPERTARALFESLVRLSPAPHAAYLGCGDHAIASASPERFLERRGSRVESRPIKGTRPRHPDPAEDQRLGAELQSSAKDRAENVMIVDVLRNDLGRVCEIGSVEVPELCRLEVFPHVFHLTSTVTGTLAAGRDAIDLLHACFPGGSITGAPKLRAMEILDQLEPHRRHLYTGAIGYLGWQGDADWNIAIRTAIVTGAAIRFAAGGGITSESDPDAEYEETLHKAEGMRLALSARIGEVSLAATAAAG